MRRVAIIGRSELMYETMRAVHKAGFEIPLVVTAKETPEYLYKSSDFRTFAESIGSEFLHHPCIDAGQLKELQSVRDGIDVAVSINYVGVIPQDVIDVFPLGILNAHAGDLPRYRGNAPVAWAMLNNEKKVGFCVHRMIGDELDSGDIICRDYYPLTLDTRIQNVFDWLRSKAPSMVLWALEKLNVEPSYYLERQSKDVAVALRGYPRRQEDGRIDWSRSNVDVLKLINASSEPFAGAFGEVNGAPLIVWRAELLDHHGEYLAVPGQVTEVRKCGGVGVLTGQGGILLREVEYNGRRDKPSMFITSTRARIH